MIVTSVPAVGVDIGNGSIKVVRLGDDGMPAEVRVVQRRRGVRMPAIQAADVLQEAWRVPGAEPPAVSVIMQGDDVCTLLRVRARERKWELFDGAPPGTASPNLAPTLRLVGGLGVTSLGVETPSTALSALMEPRPQLIAVIEMGERFTHVGLVRHGQVRYSRDIGIAGGALTDAVVQATRELPLEAERTKRMTNADDPLLVEVLKNWLQQIELTIRWYCRRIERTCPGIEHVVLSGGGAQLKGLDGWLSQRLGVPVEPFRLSAEHGLAEAMQPYANVAYGLAVLSARSVRQARRSRG
ncbi:MAG: pilus assembly protein PilM [Candidatus Xenobia bacterium]